MTTKTNNNIKTNKPNDLGKLPVWNLKDLYKSSKSSQILLDLNFIEKEAKRFEKKYEGKISQLNSSKLFKAIVKFEKIDEKINQILSYAHLLFSENVRDEKNKIFLQQMQERITEYSSFLIFF